MRDIVVEGVWKIFGKGNASKVVLKNINLTVNHGEFVIIGGKNGAGKTTLLKLMVGLLIPDRGRIKVLGMDTVKQWKKISYKIGVVLAGERGLYWKLTGRENLEIFGGLYGLHKKYLKKRVYELLKMVNLNEFADERVENYSSGMKRKLMLAKALIHEPKILFLDEMLTGIDPKSYQDILRILLSVNKKGCTIVLVTHTLHEIPENARIVFLKDGEISYDGRIDNLLKATKIKIVADIGEHTITLEIPENELPTKIKELSEKGAQNIKIEKETIYDIARRHI